jgi:AcrR family transcriptional regulator
MPRAALNPDRVTAAAADLADTVGFGNLTVAAVARSFGVADASLYAHVRNLADLRERVSVAAARELSDRLALAVAGRSRGDALAAFADVYRAFALAHPGRYAATQIELPAAVAGQSTGHRRCVQVIYALLAGYCLAEPAATDAARLLRATLHGFVTIERDGGYRDPRDRDASFRQVVAALDRAFRSWPAADEPTPTSPETGAQEAALAPVGDR